MGNIKKVKIDYNRILNTKRAEIIQLKIRKLLDRSRIPSPWDLVIW